METLTPTKTEFLQTELLKDIKEFSEYNGTECINHLNELMHDFQSVNDELVNVMLNKTNYDNAKNDEMKNLFLKNILDFADSQTGYNETYLKKLRFSINQTTKLLTEIAVYNAKTEM